LLMLLLKIRFILQILNIMSVRYLKTMLMLIKGEF
jgi:hypothetical protein